MKIEEILEGADAADETTSLLSYGDDEDEDAAQVDDDEVESSGNHTLG